MIAIQAAEITVDTSKATKGDAAQSSADEAFEQQSAQAAARRAFEMASPVRTHLETPYIGFFFTVFCAEGEPAP